MDDIILIPPEMPEMPDYFSFVDEDIRIMFNGKSGYFISDILAAQLIKEIRTLNESWRKV